MLCDQASDDIILKSLPATGHLSSSTTEQTSCQYPGWRSTHSTTPDSSRVHHPAHPEPSDSPPDARYSIPNTGCSIECSGEINSLVSGVVVG